MRVAVTGANGHVGVNLCKSLIEKGHQVRALTHQNDFALKQLPVDLFKGDVFDPESLKNFLSGVDVVFHLAAKISIYGDPDGSVVRVNTEGTRNIVEACKSFRIKRLIHFSSIHAFQQSPLNEKLDENRPIVEKGTFAYDRSKAQGERIVMAAVKDGLNAVVVSPTAIVGPMDFKPGLMGKAILQLYHHQIPALVPGGYNWVDVRDVVQGAISAMERGQIGEKYLLSGNWRSLKDFADIIRQTTGQKVTQTVMPFWVAHIGLPFITMYSRVTGTDPLYTRESLEIIRNGNRCIINDKARKELGYNPRPLEETVADLIRWFDENNMLDINNKG
ncbi:MAG: NAD-dependent epimerase/dehydratase family protein [Bacteroidota bacterium]|nr:NAD-dependent epimerase/dehydratase family protein [Bacteroidota bacterium]